MPKRLASVTRCIAGLLTMLFCAQLEAQTWAHLLFESVGGKTGSAVVIDWNSGKTLASTGIQPRATPGSTIKPLLLSYALQHGIVKAETKVFCRRNLQVGGKPLPCTHPSDRPVFDAQNALAESCNTWFAEMGRRYTGDQLESALNEAHLPHVTMENVDTEKRELAALGLRGMTANPTELARAYRELLLHTPTTSPVWLGLLDSVNIGMSSPARVAGITVLGKTGTASSAGESWTHGWFAGAVPGRFVIVVYTPHGDGGDAARQAAAFISAAVKGSSH